MREFQALLTAIGDKFAWEVRLLATGSGIGVARQKRRLEVALVGMLKGGGWPPICIIWTG